MQQIDHLYSTGLLEPLIQEMIDNAASRSAVYEVDQLRLEAAMAACPAISAEEAAGGGKETAEEALATNQANLMTVTQNVFDAIISSADQFPSQLRSMCHCLYQVLCKRYARSSF